MSEIIPDYSPTADSPQLMSSTGAELAPVHITPSRQLWFVQIIVLSSMLLSATVAVLPFFFNAIYLLIIWLIFLIGLLHTGRLCWSAKNASIKTLSVQNKLWRLGDSGGEKIVVPCDEIVLWSVIIVLPLRSIDGEKFYLLVLRDSVEEDAWRRLRVWLRVSFKL